MSEVLCNYSTLVKLLIHRWRRPQVQFFSATGNWVAQAFAHPDQAPPQNQGGFCLIASAGDLFCSEGARVSYFLPKCICPREQIYKHHNVISPTDFFFFFTKTTLKQKKSLSSRELNTSRTPILGGPAEEANDITDRSRETAHRRRRATRNLTPSPATVCHSVTKRCVACP